MVSHRTPLRDLWCNSGCGEGVRRWDAAGTKITVKDKHRELKRADVRRRATITAPWMKEKFFGKWTLFGKNKCPGRCNAIRPNPLLVKQARVRCQKRKAKGRLDRKEPPASLDTQELRSDERIGAIRGQLWEEHYRSTPFAHGPLLIYQNPVYDWEEEHGAEGGPGRSPTASNAHPIIQLPAGGGAGAGQRGTPNGNVGKKNPLSIGSIISDETH
ncbi:hypothetical protein C8R43DRAFT_1114132 [Mycena crocata]|nr:hypothetical protein C8R43DRAFT_1114132 [Mycena crocata]